ncbi:MBL fold metallo-hydrolase [Georgenia sp. MJ206]|uniref:MBL fold metallo-hydrolase n=1 Tax=Georgenia wangjunii TaxID=3117730 RepID=UPI002F26A4A2
MLILTVQAPVFATNCYLLAPAEGGEALVIDPGAGSAAAVRRTLDEHRLTVSRVVGTHGHPDHVWDAAEVAGDAPVYLGAPDLPRLADPAGALGAPLGAMFRSLTAGPWRRPAQGWPLPDGGLALAEGLVLEAVPAPGHTPGSTVLVLRLPDARPSGDDASPAAADVLAFTGDVLFAGSIGRCDLPGGDPAVMGATLRVLAGALPGRTRLLPGHGPATTMDAERATNPHLRAALGAA